MNGILSELTIEIIQKCANNCLFCSSLSGRTAKHLIGYKNIIEVGKQAKNLGLKEISISGGEPLLHPEIKQIAHALVSMNLQVAIYTTGIILDSCGVPQSFQGWDDFDKKNTRLIFGVQSSTSTVHDKITGNPGSFSLTKDSIFIAKNKGFTVEAHIVPNKINLSTLENTVHDLILWEVDKISFLRLVAQGYARTNKKQLLLDASETIVLKNIFSELEKKHSNNGNIRIGIPFSGIIEKPKACNAGETKLIIRYDGKVLPCEAFKDEVFNEYILGDIKNDRIEVLLSKSCSNNHLKCLKERITCVETCPAQFLYA